MRQCLQCGREVSPAATRCSACGSPLEAGPQASKKGSRGVFWILAAVGCGVLVLVVVGIVAAIALPNFLDATQKAKQKRTMSELRTLAVAIESYRTDQGEAPPAGSIDELAALLEPEYLDPVPRIDGWQHPIRYACWTGDPFGTQSGTCDAYRLVSPGRDGVFEYEHPAEYPEEVYPLSDYDRDIVFADGFFIQYPGVPGAAGS